jgi:hypothetical protein
MESKSVKRFLRVMVVPMALVLGLGCSSTQTLTLVSTKNVDLSAPHELSERGAEESKKRFWLLFIPFAREPSGLDAATKVLDEHEGDYLTNVEVTKTGWSILVVSWGSISVKGDVYKRVNPVVGTPPPQAAPAAAPVAPTTPAEPAAVPATEAAAAANAPATDAK